MHSFFLAKKGSHKVYLLHSSVGKKKNNATYLLIMSICYEGQVRSGFGEEDVLNLTAQLLCSDCCLSTSSFSRSPLTRPFVFQLANTVIMKLNKIITDTHASPKHTHTHTYTHNLLLDMQILSTYRCIMLNSILVQTAHKSNNNLMFKKKIIHPSRL